MVSKHEAGILGTDFASRYDDPVSNELQKI